MGRFMSNDDEDFHAKRKKVIMEVLLKGKETATQLQTLLHHDDDQEDYDGDGIGSGSAQQLALQILRSFTETLSALSSNCAAESSAAPVDCKKKGPPPSGVVKERRGCYKRRRSLDSWITVSSTTEDGCAWRKYGQKDILSSKYPRCYFRCTHKYDEGCKATKQVQRIKEDPITYQTTYFNHHTCNTAETVLLNWSSHDHHHLMIVDDSSDPVDDGHLISFESKQDHHQYSPNPVINISQVIKQELKEEEDHDAQSDDQDHLNSDHDQAKSTMMQNINTVGLDDESLVGYKPVWAPIMSSYQEQVAYGFDQSCESTSLHGLIDTDQVNHLGDIDYSWYFD